jgi:hypothetical protein
MPSSTAGKHAGSGAASNQPAVAEPTFAERARTLVYLGRVGSADVSLPFFRSSLTSHNWENNLSCRRFNGLVGGPARIQTSDQRIMSGRNWIPPFTSMLLLSASGAGSEKLP